MASPFVENRLRALGYANLIPIFKARGVKASTYKSLTVADLLYLIPDEPCRTAQTIYEDVRLIGTEPGPDPPPPSSDPAPPPPHASASPDSFPSPSASSASDTEQDGRNPDAQSLNLLPDEPQVLQQDAGVRRSKRVIPPRPPSPPPPTKAPPRKKAKPEEKGLGGSKPEEPVASKRKYLEKALYNSYLKAQLAKSKQIWWIDFDMRKNLNTFDQFINLLVSKIPKERFEGTVKGLDLIQDDGYGLLLANQQIRQLCTLPSALLRNLTHLRVRFGILGSGLSPTSVSTFLGACPNLKQLRFDRGLYGLFDNGRSAPLITLPQMEHLSRLDWAGKFNVRPESYPPKDPCHDDQHTYSSAEFGLDFGDHEFPSLQSIKVCPLCDVRFKSWSQFPKLKEFRAENGCTWSRLFSIVSTPASSHRGEGPSGAVEVEGLKELYLPPCVAYSVYMASIPLRFPQLNWLYIYLPTVAGLRSLIHTMAATRLTNLAIKVDNVFESALSTALLDEPFTLSKSKEDQKRLAELKEVPGWLKFARKLHIDIPDGRKDPEGYVRRGIGSFPALCTLNIIHMRKKVRLPLHGPEATAKVKGVEVGCQVWSGASKFPFPSYVLLVELVKCKRTLKYVHLEDFAVEPEVRNMFVGLTGCNLDTGRDKDPSDLDWYPQRLHIDSDWPTV